MATYTASFSNTSYMYLKVTATESSVSTTNNTSLVTVKVELVAQNGGYPWARDVIYPLVVKIDGVTVHNANHNYNVPKGGSDVLGTWSYTVPHNSDGSKSCAIYVKFTGASNHGYASISKTMTLTTIARASIPTLSPSSQALGSAITIYTNKKAAFTHKVRYAFGGSSGTIATEVVDSVSWTLPYALANQLPNSTSGSGTIYVDTYNGSTLIGTKSIVFTATVPDTSTFRPSFSSISHSERNSNVASKIGKYVQNISSLNLAINGAAGAYSSTIKSYSISFDNKTYGASSAATSVIVNSGKLRMSPAITDSRGRSYSSYVDVSVLAYTAPKLASVTVVRCNADGSANLVGEYAKVSINAQASSLLVNSVEKNIKTLTIDYKARTSSTYTNLEQITFNGGVTSDYIYAGFEIINSYDVRVTWSDQFQTASTIKIVSTGSVPFTIGKTGIGAGKVWEGYGIDASTARFEEIIPYKIPANANLNDYTKPGMFYSSSNADVITMANVPTNYAFSLFVELNAGYKQTLTTYPANGFETFMRSYYGGTWGSWVKVSMEGHAHDFSPLSAYPVGAIYMSVNSTSPATLFGGTWARLENRFLIGVGSSYSNGATGGAATHTLTEAEMPVHAHGLGNANANGTGTSYATGGSAFTSTYTTANKGGGESHNNMPPYLAVYMWKRTA